jgi:nucleoid DNA-binding protein
MATDKTAAKPMNKSEVYNKLAEKTKLTKKQVSEFFDALEDLIKTELTKRSGAKAFVLPGMMKLTVKKKPAQKGGVKKINQFTGQEYVTKAKPAENQVKIRPLKNLKEQVK